MRAALLAAVLLWPGRAAAYTLASGFTDSCHERITLAAIGVLLDELGTEGVTLPEDDLWKKVAGQLAPAVLEAQGRQQAAALTPEQQFVLFSAVVGVRAPDTGGHSVSNLSALRREQIDPDAQHVHCLRGPTDDGVAGDRAVLAGAEGIIRQEVAEAVAAAQRTGPARHTTALFALDFYGEIEVEVDEPSYRAGRAMHTLQDGHAHTLRSADGTVVYTVLNYIDAVAGHLDEPKDGMAHSDTMDDCHRTDLQPLVKRAGAASSALARAVVALAHQGDGSLLEAGFAPCPPGQAGSAACGWLIYQPTCTGDQAGCCTQANDYCGSPYRPIAQEKLTVPYVQAILGCQAGPGRPPWIAGVFVLLLLWRRRRWAGLALAVAVAVSAAVPARAEVIAGVEGHFSLLSDVPERSLIDATVGYAVRGGYRRGRWGVLAQIERNHWLPTELSNQLKPGALNLGVGAELLSAGGRIRSSAVVGPSILMFDTGLDGKGHVGLFFDLRPAGLRWTLGRHLALVLDPLSMALVAPVLGSPGIRQLEYRTLLGAEVGL